MYCTPAAGVSQRWVICQAFGAFKADVMAGVLGRPIRMKTLVPALRNFMSALALVALALAAEPAAAQQPTSVDPTKSAVSEEQHARSTV